MIKWLLVLLFPCACFADMAEVDFSVGQNMRPAYGADYEFVRGVKYLDLSLTGNQDFVQPYISGGYQGDYLNVGLAMALSYAMSPNATYLIGPEVGFMYNVTPLVYVKENNSYLSDVHGNWNFGATFSVGLNI